MKKKKITIEMIKRVKDYMDKNYPEPDYYMMEDGEIIPLYKNNKRSNNDDSNV